jgi:hypothetical protein
MIKKIQNPNTTKSKINPNFKIQNKKKNGRVNEYKRE